MGQTVVVMVAELFAFPSITVFLCALSQCLWDDHVICFCSWDSSKCDISRNLKVFEACPLTALEPL